MGDNRGQKRPADEAFADDLEFDRIAPNGDVTFVLDEGKTRVRVNSAIMKNASPVFAAMLGPNFKEGRSLSAGDCASVDVPLPEDDAAAFGWICRVLHAQADTNLWSPSPREIIQILDIAEKYDLLKGIQISVQVWIDRQKDSDTNDLWLLSLACCRAHDAEAFKSTTRRLIINHLGSFVGLAANTESTTPDNDTGRTVYRLAAILEESRNKALSKITRFLHTVLPKSLENCRCPHHEDSWESEYSQVLEAQRNVTEVNCSITVAIDHLFGALFKAFTSGPCHCADCAGFRRREYERIHEAAVKLETDVRGVCLPCFDGTSDREKCIGRGILRFKCLPGNRQLPWFLQAGAL